MEHELARALASLAARLLALTARDDALRKDLRTLAGAFLAATEPASPLATPVPGPSGPDAIETDRALPEPRTTVEVGSAVATDTKTKTEPVRSAEPLPELTLGKSRPREIPVSPSARSTRAGHEVGRASGTQPPLGPPGPLPLPPAWPATSNAELAAVEASCRLKAEGVRWAATRRRLMDDGAEFRAEIAPRDREIIDRGGDLDCYLWMNKPEFTVPAGHASMADAAGCFDALADAVALVRGMLPDVEANREYFEPALDLLAEAQSALRVAIARIGGPNDHDQFRVYDWLRGTAAREQIYIRRHMRIDDPANPARLGEIKGRIVALGAKFKGGRGQAKKKSTALNRLRYHAKRITDGAEGDHDWRKVAGAIDEMLGEGVPASNLEIRQILLPIVDDMPDLDDLPAGFGLALRELDHYLANRPTQTEPAAVEEPTPEVSSVARLLSGKSVVLIGGYRRPQAGDALKEAFGLKELIWLEGREHSSIGRFEPHVARSDVAVVLLAIRWSSHSFGDVREFCVQNDKPMVRLPAGYGPNQVAAQILSQCSEQLGGV